MSDQATTLSIGHRLAARRKEQGLSLEQAAEQTKIRTVYLQALEEDRYGDLPGAAYVTGFLRNYARLLEMDGQELVAELVDRGEISDLAAPPLKTGDDENRYAGKSSGRGWLVLGVLVVVAVAAALAYLFDLPPFADPDQAGQGTPAVSLPSDRPAPDETPVPPAPGSPPTTGD